MTAFSIIGLGKLGASMAAAIASRGFDVVGVDVDERAVSLVNHARPPVQETGLAELMAQNAGRLRATMNASEAVAATSVTFVVVPTPSDDRGAFSVDYAAVAFREIGRALAEKDSYHLVVLTSTVLPGATRRALLPFLEHESGKTCGEHFGLCYSPEFIALGSVIRDFLNPDFLLIGESDERAGALLEKCYDAIVENGAPCRRMTLENAELTKIALNAYVTMKITFANMLTDLCERIPGGDVDLVSEALGLDGRIGRGYLTGGLGFGGPCFPRDNRAMNFFGTAVGSTASLPATVHAANADVLDRVVEKVAAATAGMTIGVLGLAYKPHSNVIEESQAMAIARRLASSGARVRAYDPLAGAAARAELDGTVRVVDGLEECLQVDALVVATPDPQFAALTAPDLERAGVRIVVDCWRVLAPQLEGHPTIRYVAVGRSADDGLNIRRLSDMWLTHSAPSGTEAIR